MTLASDPRVADALAACRHLAVHTHHDTVTSTNDLARAAVAAGGAGGLVVSADRQSAGRGRRGRSWTDDVAGPDGPANLAVSIALDTPARNAALVPLAAGLAVAAAYRAAGAAPALKWPNDVLLDDRKAAGILVERHHLDARDVVVIGCGLDLDWRGVERAGDAAAWTSVAESLGRGVDRGAVLAALLGALDREWDGLADAASLLSRYREVCSTIGREVVVSLPGGGELRGPAVDLDTEGLLVVATGEGHRSVRAGDVTVRPIG